MKKIEFHPSKVWSIIYPLYAREIIFGNSYEVFAKMVQQEFYLTPEQWEAILENYEFIKKHVQ